MVLAASKYPPHSLCHYGEEMRSVTFVSLACMFIIVSSTGVQDAWMASATPVRADEPADRAEIAFADNPSVVDSRPLPIDSWSQMEGDHEEALALHFTIGSPACSGVHVTVHETDEAVAVELRSGRLPAAVGRMCSMIAVFGVLEVPLQSPLGDRQVLL